MKTYTAKVFSTEKYELGESPFYDFRTKTLSWVDITKGKVFTQKMDDVNPAGEKKSFNFEKPVGAAVPAKNPGSYIVAGTDALYLLENGNSTPIKNLSDYYESYQRSNDAKADPAGRLWFGSSVDDDVHEASGNLFCLDKGNIFCRQPDTKISNGLAWSRDHKKFYFSDSLHYAVFVYDYDLTTGEISNRQVLFKVENAVPDGMCIDSEDNLWVVFWGGHRIEQRSTKDGSILATVNVDATNVTSCCFMGNNLNTLFITTSGRNQTGKSDGCLFTCKVDAKGLPCDYASLNMDLEKSKMKLRNYKPEDSQIICSWIKDEKTLFQWSADRIGKFPLLGNELNENYAERNAGKDFFPLTAVDENNKVIGHLFVLIPDMNDKSTVRFGFVIVSPEIRGKGFGKKMLELAMDFSKKELNATRATLEVFANNPKAQACYEAVGFTPFSTRIIKILDSDWECIDMELKLS